MRKQKKRKRESGTIADSLIVEPESPRAPGKGTAVCTGRLSAREGAMTQSGQSRYMMSLGIKEMSWPGDVNEELQQQAVSSWCRHCEERWGGAGPAGDVQISSMFRYEEEEVVKGKGNSE